MHEAKGLFCSSEREVRDNKKRITCKIASQIHQATNQSLSPCYFSRKFEENMGMISRNQNSFDGAKGRVNPKNFVEQIQKNSFFL